MADETIVRQLRNSDGALYELRISMPGYVSQLMWKCIVSILGHSGEIVEKQVFGLDGIQAVSNALERARLLCEELQLESTAARWAGDPTIPVTVTLSLDKARTDEAIRYLSKLAEEFATERRHAYENRKV